MHIRCVATVAAATACSQAQWLFWAIHGLCDGSPLEAKWTALMRPRLLRASLRVCGLEACEKVVLWALWAMDPLMEQMANFNKGMASFASRASRVTKSHVREAKGTRVQEGDINDEMKSNFQVMQATYEKLLHGFMEASRDRFSKLEKAVNRIDGQLGRIADKLLSRKIESSRDSFNLGSARAILRSGRIMNNGRNEEIAEESNNSPRERKDEKKGIPVLEDIEGGRIQILDKTISMAYILVHQCYCNKTDTAILNPKYELWTHQYNLLRNAIMASVDTTIAPMVASATSAQQAWVSLNTTYTNSSQTLIYSLRHALVKIVMDNKTVTEYIRAIKSAADELLVVSSPLNNGELIVNLNSELGPEYKDKITPCNGFSLEKDKRKAIVCNKTLKSENGKARTATACEGKVCGYSEERRPQVTTKYPNEETKKKKEQTDCHPKLCPPSVQRTLFLNNESSETSAKPNGMDDLDPKEVTYKKVLYDVLPKVLPQALNDVLPKIIPQALNDNLPKVMPTFLKKAMHQNVYNVHGTAFDFANIKDKTEEVDNKDSEAVIGRF
ncbi:hypothetical protein LWI28_010317 [Acer negundo]|uniref:Uncharacterized protein n=1 Tax=Acer negundo TaxID=4023 RepID=A0AAD5I627_ACENE|nr:hypothetical protein LWI28_010317 [Acer negundo]